MGLHSSVIQRFRPGIAGFVLKLVTAVDFHHPSRRPGHHRYSCGGAEKHLRKVQNAHTRGNRIALTDAAVGTTITLGDGWLLHSEWERAIAHTDCNSHEGGLGKGKGDRPLVATQTFQSEKFLLLDK
jgi:hypothetical protein